jgi:hypothetical protein
MMTSRDNLRLGLLIVSGVILFCALGGVLAAVALNNQPRAAPAPPGVESFDNLSREHTDEPVSYEQNPPLGGPHYPAWQSAGFYEEPVPKERAVHTLEHGAVWITYDPTLSEDQKDALQEIVESQDCLLASPYPGLVDAPVVASAWGKQLRLESVDDAELLEEFIRAYRKGPQTPEPGAPCLGGAVEMEPPVQDEPVENIAGEEVPEGTTNPYIRRTAEGQVEHR